MRRQKSVQTAGGNPNHSSNSQPKAQKTTEGQTREKSMPETTWARHSERERKIDFYIQGRERQLQHKPQVKDILVTFREIEN